MSPYNYENDEYPRYKLNIKTYDGLGEILDRYKTEIDELLAECRIMVLEDDLPF